MEKTNNEKLNFIIDNLQNTLKEIYSTDGKNYIKNITRAASNQLVNLSITQDEINPVDLISIATELKEISIAMTGLAPNPSVKEDIEKCLSLMKSLI
jgi:hypothetical protein